MMRSIHRIIAALIATSGLSVAVAGTATYPCAWYLEANYGESRVTGVEYPPPITADEDGAGWNANGGYKFMPFFAVDAGYTSYANSSLKNSLGTTAAQNKHFSINAAAKGILPLPKYNLELFGKLGVAWINSQITNIDDSVAAVDDVTFDDDTKTRTAPYVGAGIAYVFAPELLANLQWTTAFGNSNVGKHLDLLSLGVTVLFA